MGVMQQKKEEKRRALLDAAYELFAQKGLAKTSVSDITGRANVAKGTFYLYFKDKDAVLQALLGRICYRVVREALAHVQTLGLAGFSDNVIALADDVIEAFRKEPVALRLLRRHFTPPAPEELLEAAHKSALLDELRRLILSTPEGSRYTEKEVALRISLIVGMCLPVCCSAILEEKPEPIDALKPVLYDMIRRVL